MATVEELKVSQEIIDLSDALKKEFKIGEGGIVEVPKTFYEEHLPEGLTMSEVKKLQAHNSNLVAATSLALGEASIPYFKKNKSAEQTSVEFKAGKDTVGAVFHRKKTMPNPQGGEPLTKWGSLTPKWQTHAAANLGSVKKVRQHLNQQAAAALGG